MSNNNNDTCDEWDDYFYAHSSTLKHRIVVAGTDNWQMKGSFWGRQLATWSLSEGRPVPLTRHVALALTFQERTSEKAKVLISQLTYGLCLQHTAATAHNKLPYTQWRTTHAYAKAPQLLSFWAHATWCIMVHQRFLFKQQTPSSAENVGKARFCIAIVQAL